MIIDTRQRGFRSYILEKDGGIGVQEQLKEMGESHKKQMDTLYIVLVGVIVVLFTSLLACLFGIGAMLLDGWRFHSDSYRTYVETIRVQGLAIEKGNNDKEQILIELRDLKNAVDSYSRRTAPNKSKK